MRLYNRVEFLKLPAGVIFCSGTPWSFGELRVKADTLPYNDFVALGLQWIEANDSTEATDRLDQMLAAGASFPIQTSYGRDGAFDNEEVFLVYEELDLVKMVGHFKEAMSLSRAMQRGRWAVRVPPRSEYAASSTLP